MTWWQWALLVIGTVYVLVWLRLRAWGRQSRAEEEAAVLEQARHDEAHPGLTCPTCPRTLAAWAQIDPERRWRR